MFGPNSHSHCMRPRRLCDLRLHLWCFGRNAHCFVVG